MRLKTKVHFPVAHSVRNDHSDSHASRGARGRLDRQAKLLLLVNGLFVAANALSGTFVNVYLWKMKNEFHPIAYFALTTHLTGACTFWLAGKWVKQHNKMNCLRLGVAVSALFYLLVLLLGPKAVESVLLLGVVQGMAGGFFWLAFNVVYFEITDRDNRDWFNGWSGLLGSFAGMIAPWISGFLITRMQDAAGYRLIFAISLAIFLVGVIVSFFLKKRKAQGEYEWLFFFRSLKEHRHWAWAGAALAAQGLREGLFAFIIGLLVYISTKSEMSLGNYSLVTSAIGLFSFMAAGKWLKPRYRNLGMFIGSAAIVSAILFFFWKVDLTTLLLFGISVALFYPMFSIPMTSTVYDLIGRDEESVKNRVEYVVLREFSLNAGRILGVIIFLIVISVSTTPGTLNWLMLGVGSSPLLAWFCMRNLFKNPQLNKQKPVFQDNE